MTNLEALIGELEPFTVSNLAVNKKLIDHEIAGSDTYIISSKTLIALCAIEILVQMLSLSSENSGRMSQSFDKDGVKLRIIALCKESGIDENNYVSIPTVEVISNLF